MSVQVISDELLKDLNDGKIIDIDLGMGIGFSMASEAWARQQDEYWDKTWGSGKKPESIPEKSVDEIINDIGELKVVPDIEKRIHKKGYFDAFKDMKEVIKKVDDQHGGLVKFQSDTLYHMIYEFKKHYDDRIYLYYGGKE